MADVPSGYTANYNIAKWDDGDNPGASALNNNWDLIDAAILAAYNAGGAVTSVFGRTGAVASQTSDYDASQIDNDSSVSGTRVSDALDTLLGIAQGDIDLNSNWGTKFTSDGSTPITSIALGETLYIDTPQDLRSTAAVTFATVNTGQGANELYAMDQAVRTTDDVTFDDITITNYATAQQYKSTIEATGGAADYHLAMFDENGWLIGKGSQLYFTESGSIDLLTLSNTHFVHSGNVGLYNNFSAGWGGSGWRVDYGLTTANTSTAEFDDLWVRGTMNVYELVINQIRATNGSFFVSATGKLASTPSALSGGPPATQDLTFEDPEGNNLCPFAVGDILLMQRVDLDSTTVLARIVREVTAVSGNTITVKTTFGGPTDTSSLQKGDVLVRIGSTSNINRRGSIYMSSDDSNSPFIDVYDEVSAWGQWKTFAKLKFKAGKLSGVTTDNGDALSGYGVYSDNAYFESNVTAIGALYATTGGFGGTKAAPAATINSYGLAINNKTKGNVTGDGVFVGNWQSAAGFDGAILNQDGLYGYVDNTNIFKIDTSGGLIAGFTFDNNQIVNDNFEIGISGDESYLKMWKEGFSTTTYVKMFYNDSNDTYGIESKYGDDLVFQLGSTNKIAGWTFTDTELSNSNVSLEVGTFSGLAVSNGSYDIVRVGETAGDIPGGLTNDVSTSVIFNNLFSSADTGDPATGWDINNGANCATCDVNTTDKALEIIGGSKSASLTNIESEIIQNLKSGSDTVLEGEKIKVSFTIKRVEVASSDADYRIRLTVKRNNTNYLLMQDVDTSDVSTTAVTKSYNIDASDIADIDTNGYVQFMVYADKNVAHIYDTFVIDSLRFVTYTETNITYIDETGMLLYRSPFDQIKFTATESIAHFTNIKLNNYNLGRFVGEYNNASDLPTVGARAGDYGIVMTGSTTERLYLYSRVRGAYSYVDLS